MTPDCYKTNVPYDLFNVNLLIFFVGRNSRIHKTSDFDILMPFIQLIQMTQDIWHLKIEVGLNVLSLKQKKLDECEFVTM